MTFSEAVAAQPQWLQLWLTWLGPAVVVIPVLLLFWGQTRYFALILLIATLAGIASILWLFNLQGYTRLLGLPHLIIWIPAMWFMIQALRGHLPVIPRILMVVLLATITISLAFDIVDVARYVLGERGSMVPGATN